MDAELTSTVPPKRARTPPGVGIAWIKAHVDHSGDDCLIWPFSTFKGGYGRLAEPGTNRTSTAARIMCIEAHGLPPEPGLHSRHLCGNGIKGCVNPCHLEWGTVLQNAADRIAHGRSVRGAANKRAKLSEDNVIEIKLLLQHATAARIAYYFDVSLATIKDIKAGRSWGWLS